MDKVIIEDITTEREDLRKLIGGVAQSSYFGVGDARALILSNIEKDGVTHSGIRTSRIRTIQKVGDIVYVVTRNSTYKLREAI